MKLEANRVLREDFVELLRQADGHVKLAIVMHARNVSATEAGLIYCIEPVIATILSSFLPGWISRLASITYTNETLTWSLLTGGVLIVGATVLVATERRAS